MIWNIKATLDYQLPMIITNYHLPSPFETGFGVVYQHFHKQVLEKCSWICDQTTSSMVYLQRKHFKAPPHHAFSKLFIKNKNHQRIRTSRVYFSLSTFVFKFSMSKTLPKASTHWVESTAVSIFVDILVKLTNLSNQPKYLQIPEMYATTRLLEPVMDCHTGCLNPTHTFLTTRVTSV